MGCNSCGKKKTVAKPKTTTTKVVKVGDKKFVIKQ